MRQKPRWGSDSRCCNSYAAPYEWTDFTDEEHPSAIELDAWLASLAPFARAHALGELDDLFDAASRGELQDTGDMRTPIKPIREDPEIYELRHTALSKKLRFYHGEPSELPDELVALHKHIKTTNEAQQVDVEDAADRYGEGRPTLWRAK